MQGVLSQISTPLSNPATRRPLRVDLKPGFLRSICRKSRRPNSLSPTEAYGLDEMVKEADVQIYCIGIGDTGSDRDFFSGKGLLEELAGMTVGESFFPGDANEIEDAVNRIALLLRHQYSVGYYPGNLRSDKSWRAS